MNQEVPVTYGYGFDIYNAAGKVINSLHVAELDPKVDEALLEKIFNIPGVSVVTSVKVVRDKITAQSLGYAYVNFETEDQARIALEKMNFIKIYGKVIRISFARERGVVPPIARRNNEANLYIKNLDYTVDTKALYQHFKPFGEIVSCRVMENHDGTSKGFGFVAFENGDDAKRALQAVNNTMVRGKVVTVSFAQSREERQRELEQRFGAAFSPTKSNLPKEGDPSMEYYNAMAYQYGVQVTDPNYNDQYAAYYSNFAFPTDPNLYYQQQAFMSQTASVGSPQWPAAPVTSYGTTDGFPQYTGQYQYPYPPPS